MAVVSVVTTCDRPHAFERTLRQVVALGDPVLVVDDSKGAPYRQDNRYFSSLLGAKYIALPENRGLAGALNVGLSYWLADPKVRWISYFQDDLDVDPLLHCVLGAVRDETSRPILSGRNAPEHPLIEAGTVSGVKVLHKKSTSGQHLYASADYWRSVMPIPTRALGAPMRVEGQARGLGSNVDWWIVTWAPKSVGATGRSVVCVPGLVRTFLSKKSESTWDNEQKHGEDAPLSRDAVPEHLRGTP